MKKAYFLLLLVSMFIPLLHAQTPKKFPASEISLGPEYAIPTGDFRKDNSANGLPDIGYNYGVGGSVKYLLRLNSMYGLSLQAGAVRYHPKRSSFADAGGRSGFTAIPVKLGGNFRYRSLFAEPQFGLTYFTGNTTFYKSASTTYGLDIGTYIANHVLLSGNYERWNKGGFAASHIGVRVAYTFSPRKLSVTDSLLAERVRPPYRIRPEYDKESQNWRTHRTLKTAGWVSIGVGVPLTFLGLATLIASTEGEGVRPGTYQWMIGSGVVLTTSSIPFFILSHKYKKKARKL